MAIVIELDDNCILESCFDWVVFTVEKEEDKKRYCQYVIDGTIFCLPRFGKNVAARVRSYRATGNKISVVTIERVRL